MQKNTIVEISSILPLPENTQRDMHKASKLLFPQLETAKNPFYSAENLEKRNLRYLFRKFQKIFPVCRIVLKSYVILYTRKTFGFLFKLKGGFDKNKLEKVAQYRKTQVLNNSDSFEKNYWICVERT